MFFTPRLIGVLDKCKISNRQAMHVISAVAIALGHSLDELTLNRKTLINFRKEHRKEIADEVEKNYQVIIKILLALSAIHVI